MDELEEYLASLTLEDLEATVLANEEHCQSLVQWTLREYEELLYKEEEIKDLQSQIQLESDLDKRLILEQDKKDAEDGYQMLIETFSGSRRNPRWFWSELQRYKKALWLRRGVDWEEDLNRPLFDNPLLEDYCDRVFGKQSSSKI